MNRQQFAEVTASAYVNQFSSDGAPVMNQCIIVWNGENFTRQSSLTPIDDNEIPVLSLEEGMFGDVDADDTECVEAITNYLVDSASNEIWRDVIASVQQAQADAESE